MTRPGRSLMPPAARLLARQFSAFFGVGVLAAAVHYGLLIALVEGWRTDPVAAALAGYVAGGVVSYGLNRRFTYRSDRPHGEATWRFGLVAGVGLFLTWGLMHVLTRRLGLPYLLSQVATTGVVLFWSFLAHKLWTFGEPLRSSASPRC
jgi:putative flippase GtrA